MKIEHSLIIVTISIMLKSYYCYKLKFKMLVKLFNFMLKISYKAFYMKSKYIVHMPMIDHLRLCIVFLVCGYVSP